jgi:hypothetical protein
MITMMVRLLLMGIGMVALACAISAVFFMLAWNYVVPTLTSLPAIGFLQSFCLLFMASLLFRPAKAEATATVKK